MQIGITANFDYGFYSNGLQQNIVLLYEALEKIGFKPIMIDYSGSGDRGERVQIPRIIEKKIIEHKDIPKTYFDMILFPGISCNEFIKSNAYIKNKNCRFVSIKYGNNLVSDICEIFSETKTNFSTWDYGTEFVDDILISPHYKFAESYYELIEGTKPKIMPYIWDPGFIEQTAKEHDLSIQYKPTLRPNIAILEPNINLTKNCFIPIMVASKVLKENPRCINDTYVYCSEYTINGKDRKDIKDYLTKCTPIFNHQDRVHFMNRVKIPFLLDKKNPLILSFQHLNALNYIYLEALYLGYPLVHNSEMMNQYGYYYNEFEINEAANQVIDATENHNDNLETYRKIGQEAVYKYSIHNPVVLKNIESVIISCAK